MKINCIVVDDEHFARKLLATYIEKIPQLTLAGSYKNALLAMDALNKNSIDLMFLDIQMPELKGTDFVRLLAKKPLVIFTTAYSEYAMEGYELNVVDYLLKPITFERFAQAVGKAQERLKTANPDQNKANKNDDFVLLKSGAKTHKTQIQDIFYIEGLKEYVTYHTNAEKIIVLQSLKKLEQDFHPDTFLRIHRSYIVNLNYVTAIAGNNLEINGQSLPIGKTYLKKVKERVFKA